MSNFSGDPLGIGLGQFDSSTTQAHDLGTRACTSDGRTFHYAQAGAVGTLAGKVYQSAVQLTNHLANTAPIVAVGATDFAYTPGATAGAANLYAEGYLGIDTTPGVGYTYLVSGHAAITSSTAFQLYLKDPIQVALTATSRIGLSTNKYKNVVVRPATGTATTVGVAPAVIATTAYGWLQTWGPAAVLMDAVVATATKEVLTSDTVIGAGTVQTNALAILQTPLGYAMQTTVSAKYNFIDLRIAA